MEYNPRPKFTLDPQGINVEQAQLELQLKVWKELAISKQILMRSATDVLKLDPNCSQEELKQALDATLRKIAEADANVVSAREQARLAVAEMERKLAASVRAQTAAEATAADLLTTQQNTAKHMADERVLAIRDLQAVKERLVEKEKALKAVNVALADTPENVIKKMKTFKKEKQEEADARRQAEATLGTLRKEKQQLAEVQEKGVKLAAQYRDMHALCVTLHEQLKPLVADAKDLPVLPELDNELLEGVEQAKSKSKK